MPPIPISVSKIQKKKSKSDVGQPGHLDFFSDDSCEFTGNGETSAKQVAAEVIRHRRGNAPSSEAASGPSIDWAQVRPDALAKKLLEAPENGALNEAVGGDVERPIPAPAKGVSGDRSMFRIEAMTLAHAASMLVAHAAQLRAGLSLADASDASDASHRVVGNVPSHGLSLPYEEP